MIRRRDRAAAVLVLILGRALLFSCCAGVDAASFTSVQSGPWSDPATWGTIDSNTTPTALLPGPGDDVFIATGTTVILDTTAGVAAQGPPILLNSVSVQSQAVLTCPRNNNNNNADAEAATPAPLDLRLSVATFRIESGGCFSCGYGDCKTDAEPFAGKFVLRLTSSTPPPSTAEDVRTLMVDGGGSLFLSGAPRVRSIARLAADVDAGQATLRISNAADLIGSDGSADGGGGGGIHQQQPWRVGDRVAIGPTDSIPGQTEYRTIVAIAHDATTTTTTTTTTTATSDILLTFSDPLKYAHNGRVLSLINKADNNRQVTIDTRAEVALLSRNVVIEGTNDAVTGLGGDLVMMGDNVRARLSWVELRYLGRRGHLARYPLHIHNLGDSGRDVFVSNVAIHASFQRGVVIHCTNGVTLVNNTVAGSPGFAYMLEDGAEENNVLINNYALDVKPADYPLIQTERVNAAGFWFVNAANTFIGNVAAGVAGVGFSLDIDPVLNSRPSTLSTCPDRLPGYNATLARTNATEFNRAVNTALIKKNVVRFQDNVVHSAHSGLWMSYPFTPMFFVDRPVPIVRFTGWNIASRQMPSAIDSSDGVSLQFDGCIRLQGQRGMHIYQPTCVNSDSATWASCVNTFDGLTVAWVGSDQGLLSTRTLWQSMLENNNNNNNGVMFAHLEPQVFLRTQVYIRGGTDDLNATPPQSSSSSSAPLFASVSRGGPLAALNALVGLGIDSSSSPSSPSSTNQTLIQLNGGDMHVFTDISGNAFGAGPGAVVAATSFNASGVDPLIEVYAPGQCTTGSYSANAAKRAWRDVTSSLLPNGRVIAVMGGLPMLCRGTMTPTPGAAAAAAEPLRFGGMSLGLFRSSNWTKVQVGGGAMEVDIGSAGVAVAADRWPPPLRRTSTFPVMLPFNEASMNPLTGGYSLRPIGIAQGARLGGADVLELTLTPTIQPSDGMTFVIAGLPSSARVSQPQLGGLQPLVQYGSTSLACRQMVGTCAAAKRTSNRPLICVCIVVAVVPGADAANEMVVRVQTSLAPRYVGLANNKGGMLGIYDFPNFRIEL